LKNAIKYLQENCQKATNQEKEDLEEMHSNDQEDSYLLDRANDDSEEDCNDSGEEEEKCFSEDSSEKHDSSANRMIDGEVEFKFYVTDFLLSSNLPYSLVSRLAIFIKKLVMFFSFRELIDFNIGEGDVRRIKLTIRKFIKTQNFAYITNTPYSLSIDAGTAANNREYLGIYARFLGTHSLQKNTLKVEKPETMIKMLGIVELSGDATGGALFEKIEHFLFTGEGASARRSLLMGICSDKGSNMISTKDKSLTSRLANAPNMKHLVIIHDISHALNLVLKECLKKFPAPYVQFVTDISSTFAKSPHKSAKLKELITAISEKDSKVQAIKKYVKTRWSSFCDAACRIVQLWDPLNSFFNPKIANEVIEESKDTSVNAARS